ncbi:MAG: cation diffusion facilitator family transporter [bacterium]
MSKNTSKTNKFALGIILNSGFAVIEIILGLFSNSLALISDAIHNFTDVLTLFIAFVADKISQKKSNNKNSYGLKRAGIIASLINSLILVLIALYIFYEAYIRLFSPEQVSGGTVAVVSLIGIGVNSIVAWLFSSDKNDLNVKSAYLNMLFDVLASVGAFVAGIIIYFTHITWIDSGVSFLIGILLLRGAFEVVSEALSILLEAVPHDTDIEEVKSTILQVPESKQISDLHIWSLTSEYKILTAVIVATGTIDSHDLAIDKIKQTIVKNHNIQHITIELRYEAVEHED